MLFCLSFVLSSPSWMPFASWHFCCAIMWIIEISLGWYFKHFKQFFFSFSSFCLSEESRENPIWDKLHFRFPSKKFKKKSEGLRDLFNFFPVFLRLLLPSFFIFSVPFQSVFEEEHFDREFVVNWKFCHLLCFFSQHQNITLRLGSLNENDEVLSEPIKKSLPWEFTQWPSKVEED